MTEKIKAVCIEGYCVSTTGLDEEQLKQIKPADRNDDGVVSVHLHAPPDEEGSWLIAPDDDDIKKTSFIQTQLQTPIDVTPKTDASLKLLRQFLNYRSFVDPQSQYRFHIYHMPSKDMSANFISDKVIAEIPNALKDLREVGMFPIETDIDISVLLRHDTPLMRAEGRPAFGGKCGSYFATPILGLTYEYISYTPFFKTLKHELAHIYVHLYDQLAPRWLNEAVASHAENFDPSKTPIERLQLPTNLKGQWTTKFRELKWERIYQMEEYERYQICHAFFLFIEDKYSLATIKRFYEILRSKIYPTEMALLKATGEQTLDRLHKKFQLWLGRRIIERNQEIARHRHQDKKLCKTCPEKTKRFIGTTAQNNSRMFARRIEDGLFVYKLSNPFAELDAYTRFNAGRRLYLGSNLMAHVNLKTKLKSNPKF